jgi:archaellum component FlaF (FlaF/FlaG flagellin family)
MKKTTIVLAILLFALIIIGGILYASLLGENNEAVSTASNFLTDIKNKKYTQAIEYYAVETRKELFKSNEDAINFHFLIELALLNHFNLLKSENYSFKMYRNNLWIPFTKNKTINLHVIYYSTDNNQKTIFQSNKADQVNNIITMQRVNGSWGISKINVDHESISGIFSKLQSESELDKYATVTKDGFLIKGISVNTDEMSDLEKRIMKFNFQKIIELLDSKS